MDTSQLIAIRIVNRLEQEASDLKEYAQQFCAFEDEFRVVHTFKSANGPTRLVTEYM